MSRFNSKIKGFQRLLLISEEGNVCSVCKKMGLSDPFLDINSGNYNLELIKKVGGENISSGIILDIHHVDGDIDNNKRNNLKLACHPCNLKEHVLLKKKKRLGSGQMPVGMSDCVENTFTPPFQETTASCQRNILLKNAWLPFLVSMIEDKQNTVKQICKSFSPYIEMMYNKKWGSAKTAYKYIEESTSYYGKFKIDYSLSDEIIVYRSDKIRQELRSKYLFKIIPEKESEVNESLNKNKNIHSDSN